MKKHNKLLGVIGDVAVLYVGYLMFTRVNNSINNNVYELNFYIFLLTLVIIILYVLYRIFYILKNKKF